MGESKGTQFRIYTLYSVDSLEYQIGEQRALLTYFALCIGWEYRFWNAQHTLIVYQPATNDLVGSVSRRKCNSGRFHRSLFGTMYPIVMSETRRLLPRPLIQGAIAWILSIAVSGSAVLPFITGALASKFGIDSLQPL